MKRFAYLPLLLALAVAFIPACASSKSKAEEEVADAEKFSSPEETRQSMRLFVTQCGEYVQSAADEIIKRTDSREHHRLALVWKINAIDGARQAIQAKDIFSASLDLWIFSVQYRTYLESGDGKDLFGPYQPLAVAAAKSCLDRFEALARDSIKKEQFEFARKKIYAFAAKHPIENYFVRGPFSGATGKEKEQVGALGRMVGVPMSVLNAPLRPFGGVRSDMLRATEEITHVATNVGDIADHLPEKTRWQMELMVLDMEKFQTIATGVESAERFSKSAESFAATAKEIADQTSKVPDEVRAVIAEIDTKQANLQTTLDKADATAAQLDTTIKSADAFARGFNVTVTSINETAVKWRATIEVFYKLMDSLGAFPSKEEPGAEPAKTAEGAEDEDDGPPPFDINDFGKAAEKLTVTASELRQLVERADKLVTNPVLTERLDEVDRTARATVDHITWRAILVLVAIAVIALAYRFVRVKFLAG